MNILITGGAGYIGSHAVKMLKALNHHIVVVDNLSTGHKRAVADAVVFYRQSIHDQEAMIALLKKEKIDAVLHFAAFSLVSESVQNPLKYYYNNVEGSRALTEAMLMANVHTMIFSSTAAVYGQQKTMPIDEMAKLEPNNPYGVTKKTIEDMLQSVHQAHPDFHYISLRYFNVAGAYHDGSIGENHEPETHLIPNVIKSVFDNQQTLDVFGNDYPTKDGSAIRDYIHVEDLIDAHIKALEYCYQKRQSDVFNLGTASGYSVFDIIQTTRKVLGCEIPYTLKKRRVGDPPILIASYDKALKKLGWQPKKNLEAMITSAANYYKKG